MRKTLLLWAVSAIIIMLVLPWMAVNFVSAQAGLTVSVLYCEPDLRRDCRRSCRKKYKESVVSASRDIGIILDWHRGVF